MATRRPGPPRGERLARDFFAGDAREVARAMLGKLLVRSDGRVGRLVEVEAYLGLDDPGSHAFRGPTPRAAIMFGPPGFLYVYFSYGMHWCANVVCGPEGVAAAVLLRAAQPLEGLAAMSEARSHGGRPVRERDLCRGPGRLTEAFGIDGGANGMDLAGGEGALWLADDGGGRGGQVTEGQVTEGQVTDGQVTEGQVVATPRVGLTRGAELPWRFYLAGSPWATPSPRAARPVKGVQAPPAGAARRHA